MNIGFCTVQKDCDKENNNNLFPSCETENIQTNTKWKNSQTQSGYCHIKLNDDRVAISKSYNHLFPW